MASPGNNNNDNNNSNNNSNNRNDVDRTQEWVLELHSLDSLEEPTSPATPTSDSIRLPRWSTELTPGDGSPWAGTPRNPPPWGPTGNGTRNDGGAHHRRRRSSSPAEPLPGAADCLEFVKTKPPCCGFIFGLGLGRNNKDNSGGQPRQRYRPARQTRLRNSLLAAVGFLEMANAGDFAANVFNQTPVPVYAEVLMAIGGTVALGMIYFCVVDGRLSWQNLRALREERRYLYSQRASYLSPSPPSPPPPPPAGEARAPPHDNANMVRTIDCFLDMNTREMGTEMVDRLGMDTLLGFSAFLVSLGTFLAMDGGVHEGLYVTSNLLTGYVGNTPCLVFGVANAVWSFYVWRRARKQQRAALNYVRGSTRLSQMLRNRTSSIQMHAALTGLTCFVSGIAAMVTATMWWGYVVLFPCVVTSGLANLFWRRRVGYERPLVAHRIASIDQDSVVEALRYADAGRRRVLYGRQVDGRDAFTTLVADRASLLCALDVVRKNNLFEAFCLRLLEDRDVARRIHYSASAAAGAAQTQTTDSGSGSGSGSPNYPTIDWRHLVATEDEDLIQRLLEVARRVINESALQSFIYQERHLLEVLGCYMCRGVQFGQRAKVKRPAQAAMAQHHLNVHTYAGRHANDWLFGGFSVTRSLKSLFRR